eukprot:CAMPEP_0170621054 /NCGR_PEP_ID=MMETSP0224-20130122/28397_1 /TAXON_ID=285029 /ORGANISM="Togula jolla, Strain CCCM 725" /LENGTH=267 /DNA_ID=CAMNT_0010947289 /DNA_START=23 /DNA_END=826 /DNA_ORIENTATION=-
MSKGSGIELKQQEAPAVFESCPAPSRADVSYTAHHGSTKIEASPVVYESTPKESSAAVVHGGHRSREVAPMSETPCTYESTPTESRADVGFGRSNSLADEARRIIEAAAASKGDEASGSVFESQPKPASAFVRHAVAPSKQSGEATTVWESAPTQSSADAWHSVGGHVGAAQALIQAVADQEDETVRPSPGDRRPSQSTALEAEALIRASAEAYADNHHQEWCTSANLPSKSKAHARHGDPALKSVSDESSEEEIYYKGVMLSNELP